MARAARKEQRITAPGVPAMALADLERIEADQLQPGVSLSAVELDGADLHGRELTGLRILEGRWTDVDLAGSNLTDARFTEVEFLRLTSSNLRARKATLRDCDVVSSRIGSADFFAASLSTVRFSHCKIGYLSLAEARVADLLFEDCTIEEIDFSDARVERVAFVRSTAQSLDLAARSAVDLDLRTLQVEMLDGTRSLRGVVIDDGQLIRFAPLFARQLGARIG